MNQELQTTEQEKVQRTFSLAGGIEDAVKVFNEYQELKLKLRSEGDFVVFQTNQGEREAPTKQWRAKLTRFFNISLDIIKEEIRQEIDGFTVRVWVKAIAPNGSYVVGDGACWSKTKENTKGDLFHNTYSHAVTRAKNRAVLELVGFGEVSAEEIETVEGTAKVSQPEQNIPINNKATEKQINALKVIFEKTIGIDTEEYNLVKKHILGKEHLNELTKTQVDDFFKLLAKIIKVNKFTMKEHFIQENIETLKQGILAEIHRKQNLEQLASKMDAKEFFYGKGETK